MTETPPGRPSSTPPVQYRGDDLDAQRGPGLGCFYLQMVVLGALLVITPVSVSMGAPSVVSAILLFATLGILLVSGQTIIFMLRLVAAERREGRRRPLASGSRTVGEIEDTPPESGAAPALDPKGASASEPAAPGPDAAPEAATGIGDPEPAAEETAPPASSGEGPVRQ